MYCIALISVLLVGATTGYEYYTTSAHILPTYAAQPLAYPYALHYPYLAAPAKSFILAQPQFKYETVVAPAAVAAPEEALKKHHTPDHKEEDVKDEQKPTGELKTTTLKFYQPGLPLYTVAAAPQPLPLPLPYSGSIQYHSQDELGQYQYGYSNEQSSKQETKTIDGITRGAYSYVDAEGKIQSVNYVSDALGFRVAATNLPQAPKAPEVPLAVAPEHLLLAPVESAELIEARAQHFRAHEHANELLRQAKAEEEQESTNDEDKSKMENEEKTE